MTTNVEMRSNIKRNRILYIIATALRGTALLCATGTLMQTLLHTLGFTKILTFNILFFKIELDQNALHTTLLQFANVFTIFLCSRWADKGNIFKRCGGMLILNGLLFLCFIPACIANNASWYSYVLLLGVGIMQQITVGLCTVCEYKIPYFIYKPDDYGVIASIGGIISAIIQVGVGALIAFLEKYFDYALIMIFAFAASAVFAVLAGVCHLLYKSIIDMETVQQMNKEKGQEKTVSFKEVFFHPVFIKLLPANLFRGFANGTTMILAIMALEIGFYESDTTAMAPVQSLATFIGCMLFGMITTKISPRISAFLGSILLCAGFPLIFWGHIEIPIMFFGNVKLLYISIALILFGRTFVDYAVPSVLIKAVPVEIAGTYNAWRMLLHQGGTLIATTIMTLRLVSIEVLVILTILFTIYSGFCFLLSKELREVSPAIIKRQ